MIPRRILPALALLLLAGTRGHGQTMTPTGAIRGAVFDQTGAPVRDARITAANQATRTNRTTASDGNGRFYLGNLPVGEYTVTVEADGFATVRSAALPLSVGQSLEQRLELPLAGIAGRIDVNDRPEAIDAGAATASVVLGGERIEEAPARSRNYLNFVLAAPGVAPSAGASSQRTMTGVRTPLGDSGFTFGGLRARNNAILIDGMDNRDETTGGNRVAIGLEMVQEFRVAGSAVGAELGGAAGGLLNMVTRSGVNLWHGDATFFAQHEWFNARKPEVGVPARPRFRRYQPGVSLLGPARRDRTFFAAAIEREQESAEEWSDIPADALPVINRALQTAPFAGAAVRAVLRGLYPTSTRGTEFSTKGNHQPNQRDTLSARYAFSRGSVLGEVQGPDNFADQSAQGSSLTTDHSLVGNWMRVASPRVVHDLRIHFGERRMDLSPNAPGPMLEIPGVATLGAFHRMDANRTERHYQAVENLNAVRGRHRLSSGADVHLVTFAGSIRNRFAGIYLFPTLEDFAAGRPDLFLQAFGTAATQMRTWPFGTWIQDRWEPRAGLQFEFGLRYDHQRMPTGLPASSHNLAPRFGAAWRPDPQRPFVLRTGAGFFFDRYPLAYLNDAIQKNGVQGWEQYAAGQDAIRAFALGRGAALAQPLPGLGLTAYHAAAHFPSTSSRKLTLGAEHALDAGTTLAVEGSYIQGRDLPRVRNARGTLPPSYLLEQTSRSRYLGASISLNRRLANDLAYLVSYNLGRARDDASDFDEHPSDPLRPAADWALSRQHQRHRIAASALFELPLGKQDLLPDWLSNAFDDITFAPICTLGSGRPLNTLLTTDLFRTGGYPLSARPPNTPRNPNLMRRTISLDLRVMKTIRVHKDRAVLQFGVESFNLTNHSNTERVSAFLATPHSPLATYGATLESLPARQVQFMIQFEY